MRKFLVPELLVLVILALLGRTVDLFNITVGRIVDVPEGSVDAYLAQDAYRRPTKADRAGIVQLTTDTVSRADHEAAIAKAITDTKAAAEADTVGTISRAEHEAVIVKTIADMRVAAAADKAEAIESAVAEALAARAAAEAAP